MVSVKTAVFPVAGLGTRFLPMTKVAPKEMLPIVDRPLLQYAVEEALEAGITRLVFITNSSKRAIEDYFDTHYELEKRLEASGKQAELAVVRGLIPKGVDIIYIRQNNPRGLGDAVLRARSVVGAEPFAVLLADDLIDCPVKGCLQQMIERYAQTQASVVAVETIERKDSDKYGIVSLLEGGRASVEHQIETIVEKPKPEEARSNFAVIGRYVLSPQVFDLLETIPQGAGGEIQLTDALSILARQEAMTAFPFDGRRYDCGNREGFLRATLAYAAKRSELREILQQAIAESELVD